MKTIPASRVRSKAKAAVKERRHLITARTNPLIPASLRLHRILVPIDFSTPSHRALNLALDLAQQFCASLVLLHVIEPVVYPSDWIYPLPTSNSTESKKVLLTRLKDLMAQHAIENKSVVRVGRAWQEIVALAAEARCDLIVIATHGYTGVKHALLGSVAEKVVRHAKCAVLALRAPVHGSKPARTKLPKKSSRKRPT